ncbi:hypothetical protein [Tenacibaculum sp. Ill]|uniref:hypothetical protein n=1 Tax=Tenacibaculum sp. Ill TaxID=3445935 RepID=UPI003F7A4346
MTQKSIKNIISNLENNKKEEAFFGFYNLDGDEYSTTIKANRQGLELFSAELLKASIEIENRDFKNGEIEPYEIDISWTDLNADFYFESIELTKKIKTIEEKIFPEYKETWKDKLYKCFIGGAIICLMLILIIGSITVLKWIF